MTAFPYQEFPLLLPLGALSVSVLVGLCHQVDQIPLVPGGLWAVLEGLHHLLLLASLPVLLYEAPLRYPFGLIQHHCGKKKPFIIGGGHGQSTFRHS